MEFQEAMLEKMSLEELEHVKSLIESSIHQKEELLFARVRDEIEAVSGELHFFNEDVLRSVARRMGFDLIAYVEEDATTEQTL